MCIRDRYAMHVKGLELPAYDPRGAVGIGLTFATANRGGCHVSGYTIAAEVIGSVAGEAMKVDPLDDSEKKVELTILFQDLTAAVDSAVNCLFLTFGIGAEEIAKREGFGDVLADGARKAAERIGKGAEKYACLLYTSPSPRDS